MNDLSKWDARYRAMGAIDDSPAVFLLDTVKELKPGRALDLACGAGRNSIYLAMKGWQVEGVDSSAEGLRLARSRADSRGLEIEFREVDLESGQLELEEQGYDLIINFCYLYRPLWSAIRSGLKVGCAFVAEIHLLDTTPGLKAMRPEFLVSHRELLSEFSAWNIEHYTEAVRTPGLSRKTARLFARRP